jgi:electron transport complex protein RnfC
MARSPAANAQETPRPTPAFTFRDIPLPARLFVPCAAEPKAIGMRVQRGDSLATDDIRCPAPASGEIVGVSHEQLLGGVKTQVVVLATDADQAESRSPLTTGELVKSSLESLPRGDPRLALDRLERAGVTADRWTSPDLIGQIRAATADKPIDAILCGALDLDPALPMQTAIISAHALEVAAGIAAIGRLLGAKRSYLAVPEDIDPATIRSLRDASVATDVRLYPLYNEYPLGNASMLILRALGRRLKPGKLPTEVRVVLLDAIAAIGVSRCLIHGQPTTRVPFGVYDQRSARAEFLRVPVGTKLREVARFLDVPVETCDARAGHRLRDIPVSPDSVVGQTELTIFAAERHGPMAAAACLRCAWCVEACPVQIHPAGLLEAAQQNDSFLAESSGLKSCIECGICGHVCPSHLPLLPAIRLLRGGR